MALAANDSSLSTTDTRRFIDWLDKQRQLDHERLVVLGQAVDQFRKDLRDQSSALTQAETTSIARSSTDMRSNEGVVVNLADQIVRVERVVDEHIANQTRTSQAENALRERERRQNSEFAQQVDLLSRALGLSTGRVSALSEEIRHERESRATVAHAFEELQQLQTGVSTRTAAMEQMVRRMSGTLSGAEASDEKLRTDLARVDNQIKLVDLRVTRDLAEIQRIVGEWKTRVDEQVKPVEGLARLVGQLADQRGALQARSNVIGEAVERLGRDAVVLETQAKSDRTAIQRGAESVEVLARRLEATGSSIWQIGERISALVQDLDQVRLDLRTAHQETGALNRRADLAEESQPLVEGTQLTFALDLRTLRTDARAWSDAIEARLDSETTAIVGRGEARYRRSVEHLRRSADEINQQVRELEADLT